jgi:hypothetical protein
VETEHSHRYEEDVIHPETMRAIAAQQTMELGAAVQAAAQIRQAEDGIAAASPVFPGSANAASPGGGKALLRRLLLRLPLPGRAQSV